MNLVLAAILTFLINIPFGYWRTSENKFSLNWFLSIHIPIPFVILFRYFFDLGFALYTYPVMVTAFFTGQFAGKLIEQNIFKNKIKTSKCFCSDFIKYFS
jgi:hypothetical protein